MRPIRLAHLGKLNWRSKTCTLLLLYLTTAITLPAQTFTILHNFGGTQEGVEPVGALVQGIDGKLYGTTFFADAGPDPGTVFKITTGGTLTTLHKFVNTDGANPDAELARAFNGNFYGTTSNGGADLKGTIFRITPGGTLTTLHNFSGGTDGASPQAGLVAVNGSFYGTTFSGGASGDGTVFKITSTGILTPLHSFDITDGANPSASLVQAINGNLYGTTSSGGASGGGTVFKITPGGALTPLHSFDIADGSGPDGDLVQGTDGDLYGTTEFGGTFGDGTIFKINPISGTLTVLYNFDNTDGANPQAGLTQGTDGNFYGTTSEGGAYGEGTVFTINPTSKLLTTLHNFNGTDGSAPLAGVVQDTDGNFYGTTLYGGINLDGTVFSLSVNLGPFVETQPTYGKVGAAVKILGTDLTGATNVSFNSTTAAFTVVSSSLITTTVPNGATTGSVSVTTPGGTLFANKQFRILPQITSFTPTSGPVGTSVILTGVSLTQTLKITFGGVSATSFTVNSDTQVTVTVPAGAKSGKIAITTAGGSATSSGKFTVT